MILRSWPLLVVLCALAGAVSPARPSYAAGADEAVGNFPGVPEEEDDDAGEEEDEGLQQRLTEREDKRRPLEPFTTHVAGYPLTLGGEYEVEVGYVRKRVLEAEVDGKPVREPDQLLLQQQLEIEGFYTLGEPLSFFVQVQGVMEEDLLGASFEAVSDLFIERGEMWLYSEDVLGSDLSFDIGRLDFEDDRRWWWDDELDAARLTYEYESFEVALALGYELASDRSDQSFVDPEHERVLRWIAEASWDFSENHSFQLFLLHQDDHSRREQPGDSIAVEREDESDARLTWAGVRETGIFELGAGGHLGYWLDGGLVYGAERVADFLDPVGGRSEVDSVGERRLRGWAGDVGASWLLPLPCEPRLFAGYAYGSEEFRQTGLHADEAGFGGVERFDSYGLLLQPELANLGIVTVGAGLSLLRSSSLDLVYHSYRLVAAAEELQDSRLQHQLDDANKQLGHEVDLVLALEEWERLELDIAVSVLRTSNAFGISEAPGTGDDTDVGGRAWVVGGFFAVRYAF